MLLWKDGSSFPVLEPCSDVGDEKMTPPPLELTGGPREVAVHGGQRAGEGTCSHRTLPFLGTGPGCGDRALPW